MDLVQKDKYNIFSKTKVGFEFEFFSDLKATSIRSILRKTLNRKVKLSRPKKGFSKTDLQFRKRKIVTDELFRLEKDYSGGPMMYELITGPMDYFEAKKILQIILNVLYQIGWVNDLSSLHINISFDDPDLDIRFINILKFCLNFKEIEKSLFKHFPSRRKNIYSESITQVLPDYSSFTYDLEGLDISNADVKLPTDSKYFGVNFKHLKSQNGYLEFRYIGGRNYLSKNNVIVDYLEQFVLFTYKQTKYNKTTVEDNELFQRIVQQKIRMMRAFKNVRTFKEYFTDIELSVDLKYDYYSVNYKFADIKEQLYNLVINNGMREGYVNYDSDISKLQIKEADIQRGVGVNNIDFVNCTVRGTFDNCNFYECVIKESMIFESELKMSTELKDTKVSNCPTDMSVRFKNCFIRNDYQTHLGIFEQCVIVGSIDMMHPDSSYSDDCLFVDPDYASKKGYSKKLKK